jgi:NRAMP (natural resistance-associated macrophage protein)-like metal ion transporter
MKVLADKRARVLVLLGAIGPGVLTAMAGNDAGGISTFSVAGAEFGYATLWLIPIMTLQLAIVQETVSRMGAVSGKGFAALIREKFGLRPSFLAMILLLLSNLATSVSEFAGIAAATSVVGVSKYISVPIAALVVWLLVVRGSYRNVEKILLGLSAVFVAYLAAMVLSKPDWGEVARATLVPTFLPTQGFILIVIAAIGTTVAPWMQFFQQANVVDKGVTAQDIKMQRIDVVAGAVAAGLIAWAIVVTTGTILFPQGIRVEDAASAALALEPALGTYATGLFAVGLFSASLLAACVLPLTAAYAVCEAFGWERGLDRSWSEAPAFNAIYTFVIVFGAAFVLVPELDLIALMVFSQFVGGILLPFLLVYMIKIANDRRIMGRFANGRAVNTVSWATVVVIVALTLALIAMTLMGMV